VKGDYRVCRWLRLGLAEKKMGAWRLKALKLADFRGLARSKEKVFTTQARAGRGGRLLLTVRKGIEDGKEASRKQSLKKRRCDGGVKKRPLHTGGGGGATGKVHKDD